MRRVIHSIVPQPSVLTSEEVVQVRAEISDFLHRSTEELSTRRAPLNERIYRNSEVRTALERLFHEKCAYCEDSDRKALDVEHHRPAANAASRRKTFPHHYSWLAYEWENLLLVCHRCQGRKRTLFPLRGSRAPLLAPLDQVRAQETPDLIDPGYDRPERHLDFALNGSCYPRTARGAATIAILELNRLDLLASREKVFRRLANQVRGSTSAESILQIIMAAGDPAAPFAGALQILVNRYALAIAEKIGHYGFSFDDTRGLLPRLHERAGLDVVLAAFDSLETAREFDQAAARARPVAYAPAWHGWTPPIRQIAIRDFKAIEELSFELPPRRADSSAAACLMLLGENATGKSTVLEAVTLALIGTEAANRLGLRPKDYLRRRDPDAPARKLAPASVRIDFYEGSPAELIVPVAGARFEGSPKPSANVLAYGSRRFFLAGRRWRARSGGVRGLFDPMWVLPHPDLWLRTLDDPSFEQVARALREVLTLPDESEFRRDKEEGVVIQTGPHEVAIERHSDGYRSLFATAVDIMHGMMGAAADLSEARGVVMIDEIETHLHPRWKLRVMTALRKALPQVQFLVTTHDPLSLRGMSDGEVQVMIRDEGEHIERLEGLPDVRGLRAEQLLTSDYFGLASTADPELEVALAHKADLAQRSAEPTIPASPLDKLSGAAMLGDTPQEQLAVEAMDAFLEARDRGTNEKRKATRKDAVAALKAVLEAGPTDAPA